MPRISVALASFNGERHIGEQLETIARQSRLPDEVVITDDLSSDRTAEIVASYAGRLPIRFSRNGERKGAALNFLGAITATTGDLVILSDQDDRWSPRKVETLATRFATSGGAVTTLYHACAVIDGEGRSTGRLFPEIRRETLADRAHPMEPVYGMAMAFSGALRSLLGPDGFALAEGTCGHDEWICLVAGLFGPILHLPDVLGDYRIHSGNSVGLPRERPISPLLSAGVDSRSIALRYAGLLAAFRTWEAQGLPAGLTLRPDRLAEAERIARLFAARAALYGEALKPVRPLAAYADMLRLHAYGPAARTSLGWRSALKDAAAALLATVRP